MTNDETARKAETPANEVASDDARRNLGELLNRVGFGGERIVITRHGEPVAVLVSVADHERLIAA